MASEPRIEVHCPTGAPAAEILCSTLVKELRDQLSGARLQPRVTDAQLPPARPGVRLVLDTAGSDHLSGHLEWQSGSAGLKQGPVLSLDVMDAPLSPSFYPRFIRALLTASPELAGRLTRTP